MRTSEFVALHRPDPSCEAVGWGLRFETMEEAWAACREVTWMIWVARKLRPDWSLALITARLAAESAISLNVASEETIAAARAVDSGSMTEEDFVRYITGRAGIYGLLKSHAEDANGQCVVADFMRRRFNPFI